MDNGIVTIKCFDSCVFTLVYPDFFTVSDKATLRKLFKYMFRFDWRNEETIAFFEREFEFSNLEDTVNNRNAEKIAKARIEWNDRVDFYNREYKDPKCAATPDEKRKIREQNAARNKRVREAYAALRRAEKQAQKDLEKCKEIRAIYQEAKTK